MKTKILRNTLSGTLFSLGLIFAVAAASETLAATVPFPALTAVNPFGSFIYEGSVDGTVPASATQSFTLDVNDGQTITISALPAAGLQPTIELRDPSNTVMGSATAFAAGQEVVLQTAPATPNTLNPHIELY